MHRYYPNFYSFSSAPTQPLDSRYKRRSWTQGFHCHAVENFLEIPNDVAPLPFVANSVHTTEPFRKQRSSSEAPVSHRLTSFMPDAVASELTSNPLWPYPVKDNISPTCCPHNCSRTPIAVVKPTVSCLVSGGAVVSGRLCNSLLSSSTTNSWTPIAPSTPTSVNFCRINSTGVRRSAPRLNTDFQNGNDITCNNYVHNGDISEVQKQLLSTPRQFPGCTNHITRNQDSSFSGRNLCQSRSFHFNSSASRSEDQPIVLRRKRDEYPGKKSNFRYSSFELTSRPIDSVPDLETKQSHLVDDPLTLRRRARRHPELLKNATLPITMRTPQNQRVYVVSAFEQSLANMAKRLENLTISAAQKDAELQELRQIIDSLRYDREGSCQMETKLTDSIVYQSSDTHSLDFQEDFSEANGTMGRLSINTPKHASNPFAMGCDSFPLDGYLKNPQLESVATKSGIPSKKASWLRSSFGKAFRKKVPQTSDGDKFVNCKWDDFLPLPRSSQAGEQLCSPPFENGASRISELQNGGSNLISMSPSNSPTSSSSWSAPGFQCRYRAAQSLNVDNRSSSLSDETNGTRPDYRRERVTEKPPRPETLTEDRTSSCTSPRGSTVSGSAVLSAEQEIDNLRKQLEERETKLTDAQLQALASAHQVDQLRDQMSYLFDELTLLRVENERLQRLSIQIYGGVSYVGNGANCNQTLPRSSGLGNPFQAPDPQNSCTNVSPTNQKSKISSLHGLNGN